MDNGWFNWKWQDIKDNRAQQMNDNHAGKKDSNGSNIRAFVHEVFPLSVVKWYQDQQEHPVLHRHRPVGIL